MKDIIFSGLRPYSPEPLERLLKHHLGENTTMSELEESPNMIITSTLASSKPHELKLMRNFPSAFDILGLSEETDDDQPGEIFLGKVFLSCFV